jgi:acetyl-CoA decarbonylase/synthase complex subunit gamma
MKYVLLPTSAVILVATGMTGKWFGYAAFEKYAIWFLGIGFAMLFYAAIKSTYYRSRTPWVDVANKDPQPLRLTWLDYLKAGVCWLDAFKRTYAFEPGLYYTGEHYDSNAPLLVTANYFLTVFLVARRIRAFDARLIVIDTDGINVWCSAGKGQFSHTQVLKQLDRYGRKLLTDVKQLSLILPKLALSGVNLRALRKANVRPVIGPVYAKDLPEFLSHPPYNDRVEDKVIFGLQSRLFTWLPGLLQALVYSFAIVLAFWGIEHIWGFPVPMGLIVLTVILATVYPIFFPWIPGIRFAVKGLWLAAFSALVICILTATGVLLLADLPMTLLFTFGTAVFFGLSYTGNSAVSNYSRVRREIAGFLPLYVFLYAASFAAFLITEVYR